jgi:hypothetical protein
MVVRASMTLVTSGTYGDFGPVLAGEYVMFGEDKMALVTSCHQRAFLFTNTRLFYVIATG